MWGKKTVQRYKPKATDYPGEVAFLKIDIEGAELDLIPAIDAAGLFGAIRCTVVETHERKFRDRAADFQAMRALIGEKYAPSHVSLDWI